MKYVYPAVFYDDEGKVGVIVPDIPNCFTFGDTKAEAIEMAEDVIAMLLCDYEDNNQAVPVPSDIKDLRPINDGFVSMVLADTDEYRRINDNRAVKKTLTIPSWLNYQAERVGINFSQVLQAALKEKLKLAK